MSVAASFNPSGLGNAGTLTDDPMIREAHIILLRRALWDGLSLEHASKPAAEEGV